MFRTQYESLTLHNICDSVWGWRERQRFDGLGKERELYWLGKLEEFLYAI